MRKLIFAGMLGAIALVALGAQSASADRGFSRAMCGMAALSGDRALRVWCYEMQAREDERRWRKHEWRHHYGPRHCWYDRYGYQHCR